MSILIVEDNEISGKILEANLQKLNYETIVARNGKEALVCLSRVPEIGLVIMDIMMPEINGLELLAKVKRTPEWKDIPVIMCTSLANAETIRKAMCMGSKYYLMKPINPKMLRQKVAEVLRDDKPVLYNENQIIRKFGLDRTSYKKIIRAFYDRLRDKINLLEQQIENRTATLLHSDLQELSESASIVGAKRVVDILDRLATKSEGLESAALISEYRLLLRELKSLEQAIRSSL